jgi:hypothetical protein
MDPTIGNEILNHPPLLPQMTFRHYEVPTLTLIDLPTIIFEIPDFDFEPWLVELWNDFLIEPTPYLVIWATAYLGCILLLSQYYATILWVVGLWVGFIPWDDEWVLRDF